MLNIVQRQLYTGDSENTIKDFQKAINLKHLFSSVVGLAVGPHQVALGCIISVGGERASPKRITHPLPFATINSTFFVPKSHLTISLLFFLKSLDPVANQLKNRIDLFVHALHIDLFIHALQIASRRIWMFR
ncbi:hypothetical protein L2E82_05759 [Cichorium intybus]|uniref:Uncharacterized protein n=1 Tax=Cichorium intybus TaxID=13427 RepID=A0ACB9H804_CICIN|nr:hypothetical protein L2E82_05759 [Cichorium intybus]